MARVTKNNYHAPNTNNKYMSVSQYKRFCECEAAALAEINGTYERPKSSALLIGSYVDEMLTGTKKSQEKFIEENYRELYNTKDKPYADTIKADEAIEKVKKQPLMMKYLTGRHQKIMTGTIGGVEWKIKMDTYSPGKFISDLKYMASLRSPNMFESMVKYWNYMAQGAVYQEIVYQNTGERLPFYLVIATKEKPIHLEVCEIKQYDLDDELKNIIARVERFQAIKNGIIQPERCEKYDCEYCTETRILDEPIDSNLLGFPRKL